jgi:prevent-host-death family protein
MRIDTDDTMSVGDANNEGVSKLVSRANEGRPVVLTKHGKPAAAVIDPEAMERLQRVDELEDDMRLLAVAWVRALTDSGERFTTSQVAAKFGIDLDDPGDED